MSADLDLEKRNPGPSWGFAIIYFASRIFPWPIMRIFLRIGSLVGLCIMPLQRGFSRAYLKDALGRAPTWIDCWNHFTAFSEFLVRRFDAAGGSEVVFESLDGSKERLIAFTEAHKQALHGTFHFGNSDLMGFWLSEFDLSIRMVRYQVGNSNDLKWLERRFGDKVGFLWVNQPENLLFALKDAVADQHNIAMKCDRIEHSSKHEEFDFLGAKRIFPFTIYYLSILFDLPVVFTVGVPTSRHGTCVYSSDAYYPVGKNKAEKLENARIHFQSTLKLLNQLVRKYPYQWFNFLDAVPIADQDAKGAE